MTKSKYKCRKCKKEFEMPDDFVGRILCEDCDPFMSSKGGVKMTKREIKFRALSRDTREGKHFWVYCLIGNEWYFPIKEETVGQYTALKDKNGIKEIYEGDILKHYNEFASLGEPKEFVKEVKWDTYYGAGWNFGLGYKDGEKRWSYPQPDNCEVIGNIYENPELLEEKQ